ncbi:MAG: PAS domain-containing protein [Oscillospiraceae bacterium]
MKNLSEIKEDLLSLALPIGLVIAESTPSLPIICVNDFFVQMLGYSDADELFAKCNGSAWEFVSPADIKRLTAYAATRVGTSEAYEITYQAIRKDGSLIWINQNARHTFDENGRDIVFAYCTDVTAQKEMEETIRAGVKKYETLVNSVPGGVIMYHLDGTFTPIVLSDRVYELSGMTKEEYLAATCDTMLDILHPDDRQGFIDAVNVARDNRDKFDYTYRVLQKNGSYRWTHISGKVMDTNDNFPTLYAVLIDINEQIKTEHALRESESRYAAAVRSSNINIGEYDYATDTMYIFSKSPKVNQFKSIVNNYTKNVISSEHISNESATLLYHVLEELKNGAPEMSADFWIRNKYGDEFWCERVVYTNSFDEGGKPVKAYCVGRDITNEKEAEKRYYEERSYREAVQKATMSSINMNLTQNTILDFKSIFNSVNAYMSNAKTAQDYFDNVCRELSSVEMQKKYISNFSCDALLWDFANGKTTISMEFTRRIEKRLYWVMVTVNMMKRENGDIIAFLYSTDITNERTMQNIMNTVVTTDYDFLVVADVPQNTSVRYSQKNIGNNYLIESDHFIEDSQNYVRLYICPEDVERVLKEMEPKNVLAHLDSESFYSIFYSVPNSEGSISKKQLRFSYIDREQQCILLTRVDITAAVEEQEKKNKELMEAVTMAERANAAKSEFLSHISHEIRTPMNAILGMDQLASQRLNDPEFVGECIKKSQYASRYLLQLINDILDMSKIENSKIAIKNEPIVWQPFLNSINTIINTQAEIKGVKYVITQFENCKNSYMGDAVRLQQILINILSNAVKFTPKNGEVHLDISQISADEKVVNICFKISDTGIGINEEFLPDIFKPFSQEHSGTRSGYGGSGLGLAISNNLVGLMKGNISVESIVGKGTTFRVEIPFEISKNNSEKNIEVINAHNNTDYDFRGKKILLVEDHPLNVLVATKLLEHKNAYVDVAENGKMGVEMFANAPEYHYDAILMDIRMPIMDGLQATEAIRHLDNQWAKIVPIIAMSANAFDDDVVKSKNAGMNAHLAKPIEAGMFYQVLYELMFIDSEKTDNYH